MTKTALIIEDEKNISDILRTYLEKDGFTTYLAEDGIDGLAFFGKYNPDVVLLDLMLPSIDGWEVCKKIREQGDTPIIMLTAKSELIDKVQGLELGADDYITKPFEGKEVVARIHSVMRRTGFTEHPKKLVFPGLSIDMNSFILTINGEEIETPQKELQLLFHLASSPNRVYTRKQLLDEVWGYDYFGDSRTVDVHIKRLREKLEDVSDQWSLKTVWGVGYKFEAR